MQHKNVLQETHIGAFCSTVMLHYPLAPQSQL